MSFPESIHCQKKVTTFSAGGERQVENHGVNFSLFQTSKWHERGQMKAFLDDPWGKRCANIDFGGVGTGPGSIRIDFGWVLGFFGAPAGGPSSGLPRTQ